MSDVALDDLERARLDWPEPILIDLISGCFGAAPNRSDRIAAARIHVRFLQELIEGEPRRSAFLRLELITCCAPRGIGMNAIEAADAAAFRELTSIIEARFRNSSRIRRHFLERLDDAVARMPARVEPARASATIRMLASPRDHWSRSPRPIERGLAVTG